MTTYKESGVDVDKNDRLVDQIKQAINISTGFADTQMIAGDQFISTSCDGVGTKIRLASRDDFIYSTIGQDLVGMCANDLICSGARPAFFLDYIGMNSLEEDVIGKVIRSINWACNQFGMRLVGGEMAELPNNYTHNKPELVGVAIGFGSPQHRIDKNRIKAGDVIVGLPSSGLHSNGYSLINKIFDGMQISSHMLKKLTEPTKLYTGVNNLYQSTPNLIKSIAHITGGGLVNNLSRAIPEDCEFHLEYDPWFDVSIFDYIKEIGEVDQNSMNTTFNMGIGMCLVVAPEDESFVRQCLRDYDPAVIGRVD